MEIGNHELKLDRSKINANFDGYKLSLDFLPITCVEFSNNIDTAKLSTENYTYQNIKLFGMHNALYNDNFNPDNVYFVDDHWHILRSNMIASTNLSLLPPSPVFTIPNNNEGILTPGRVPISMHFTNEQYAVVANGTGTLHILKTGLRNDSSEWKEVYKGEPLGIDKYLIVLYSNLHIDDQTCFIEVACIHISKNENKEDSEKRTKKWGQHLSGSIVHINWLSFTSDDAVIFKLSRQRSFESSSIPDYLTFDKKASSILIACERPVKMVFDSLNPIVEENIFSKDALMQTIYTYSWRQTEEDIVLCFKLLAGTSKSQISVDIQRTTLSVKLADVEKNLIDGDLFDEVVVENCIWIVDDKSVLEITLQKLNKNLDWPLIVKENYNGERIYDEDQIDAINQRLAPFTSDDTSEEKAGAESNQAFNVQQIEECDNCPEEYCVIYCFDGNTHKITQEVELSSNQFLFAIKVSHEESLPFICLRHDVDGVVWRPEFKDSGVEWFHDTTFDAFGYVQASKQQKKFTLCAPDFSYVSIVDCQRHAYIYRRSSPIASPLRNRKSGELVTTVAKQQVISLETNGLIEGAVATNSRLFLIVDRCLFSIRIQKEQ